MTDLLAGVGTLAVAAGSTAAAVDETGKQTMAFAVAFTSCMGIWAVYEVVRGVCESQRAASARKANESEVELSHTFS